MDREKIENVVKLAKEAHEATQKAKQSYGAYVSAASALYSEQAAQTAKEAYEGCMHSTNFMQSFIERLSHDFKTTISAEHSGHSFAQATTSTAIHIPEPDMPELHNSVETKPVKDLFTVEFDEEEGESTHKSDVGWQSRGA